MEDNKGTGRVGMVGGGQSTVLGEVAENFNGTTRLCMAKQKEFVEVG